MKGLTRLNNLWEIRAESEDATSLDLYIYSTVESDNWWEKSETSAQHFRKELEKHKNLKQINVYINSAGGSVLEAVQFIHSLNAIPQKSRFILTVLPVLSPR